MKDLYSENYKTLIEETEDDAKKWKEISGTRVGRLKTAKISILPKAIYRLNAIPTKITNEFFYRTRTSNFLKFVWNQRNPQQPKQS